MIKKIAGLTFSFSFLQIRYPLYLVYTESLCNATSQNSHKMAVLVLQEKTIMRKIAIARL